MRSGVLRLTFLALAGVPTTLGFPKIAAALQSPKPDAAALPTLAFSSVSTEGLHTCALTNEGVAYCWGGNSSGQLGSDSAHEHCEKIPSLNPCSTAPLRVKGEQRFTSIGVGSRVTCGLAVSGAVYCWGDRSFGPTGDTAVAAWTTPVMVADTPRFVSLGVGHAVFCGVTASGAAYCAGEKNNGLLGTGEDAWGEERQPVPVSGGLAFSAVGIGDVHACGLARDGRAYCWGADLGWGVLGRFNTPSPSPLLIADAPPFRMLSAGAYHHCGVTADGTGYCWGGNPTGQLGDGTVGNSTKPVPVDTSLKFRSVSAGGFHTCALTPDGTAYCWGDNAQGQLGNPDAHGRCRTSGCSRQPRAVAGGLKFTTISAGGMHTCAVATDGGVYCWGSNSSGELGVALKSGSCGFGIWATPCSLTPRRVSDPRP